jgi:hypothetical protein
MGGGALSLDDRPASPGRSKLVRHVQRDASDREKHGARLRDRGK